MIAFQVSNFETSSGVPHRAVRRTDSQSQATVTVIYVLRESNCFTCLGARLYCQSFREHRARVGIETGYHVPAT
jgi:hypothetical protein